MNTRIDVSIFLDDRPFRVVAHSSIDAALAAAQARRARRNEPRIEDGETLRLMGFRLPGASGGTWFALDAMPPSMPGVGANCTIAEAREWAQWFRDFVVLDPDKEDRAAA